MIELNPEYERIFSPENIDKDCDKIAHHIDVVGLQIKEILKIAKDIDDGRVGLYKMAVTKYLQLLKSMTIILWRMSTGATLTIGTVPSIR